LGFLDALFEAISGVTTTGLSTKATLVDAPQTFLFCPRLDAMVRWAGRRRTLPGAHYATGSGGEGPGCHRGRNRRFGRGFNRIVTSIGDPQFEGICHELGLKDTIIPSRTITRYLVDMVGGGENVELSTVIKDEARFFILIAGEEDAVAAKDLKLPAAAKVICYYRDGKFSHADDDTTFRIGDEVVILTHSKNMPALQERWQPKPAPEEPADSATGQETRVQE
jgi:hypothetical protein